MTQKVKYIIVALLIFGCERNNATVTGSIDSDKTMPTTVQNMSNPEPYSDSFQFDFSLSYDELEFNGTSPDGLDFSFEASSSNAFELSVPMVL